MKILFIYEFKYTFQNINPIKIHKILPYLLQI